MYCRPKQLMYVNDGHPFYHLGPKKGCDFYRGPHPQIYQKLHFIFIHTFCFIIIIFIFIFISFSFFIFIFFALEAWRAAQELLAGHMQPTGCRLPDPYVCIHMGSFKTENNVILFLKKHHLHLYIIECCTPEYSVTTTIC